MCSKVLPLCMRSGAGPQVVGTLRVVPSGLQSLSLHAEYGEMRGAPCGLKVT
jgi:hypothetical protein